MRIRTLILALGLCLNLIPVASQALVKLDLTNDAREDDVFLDSLRVKEEFTARVESQYADVPKDHWAYGAVERLAALGLLEGYRGEPIFYGNALVTRYEMAAMVARLVDRFVDLKSNGLVHIGKTQMPLGPPTDPFDKAGPRRLEGGEIALKPISESAGMDTSEKQPVTMEQADVAKLEDLVNAFSTELQDFKSSVQKDLTAGKKIYLRNQQDIKSLKEENERFAWKGRAELAYTNAGELDSNTEVVWKNNLELDLVSKPRPGEDFVIGATLAASTDLGGRKGQEGVIDGSNTALSMNKLYLNYTNPLSRTTKSKFFFRKMDVGNIAVDFSPTTAFGKQWEGAQGQFQAGQWTLNVMAARTQHRRLFSDAFGRPFTFIGKDEDGKDDVPIRMEAPPYDRYVYGASLQGTFLGNQLSLFRISQINMFEDEDSVRVCEKINAVTGKCENYLDNGELMVLTPDQVGGIANPGYPQDLAEVAGGSNDTRVGQLKLPAEKNTVQSVFLRYPLSEKHNLFFTGEYARTTYFRPSFRVPKGVSDPPDPDHEPAVSGPDISKYRVVPEQDWNGSAVLALLDWSKGPLKIFPAGYARLSPRFVSRYLGLPGIDLDNLLSVGGLPLNIQSLEAWIFAPTYTKPEDKYTVGALFAKIQEVEPIYFDPALITAIPSLGGILPLTILERLNNRRGRLGVGLTSLNGEYYASPRLTLKATYLGADVKLFDGCIDGKNPNNAEDFGGGVLDTTFGDGIHNCVGPGFNPNVPDDTFDPFSIFVKFKTQTMSAEWQASNKAKYTLTYSISDLINQTASPAELGPSGIIEALYNRKTYSVKQTLNYDFNNATSLNLSLERVFDRLQDGSDVPGGAGANPRLNGVSASSVDDYYVLSAKIKTEF